VGLGFVLMLVGFGSFGFPGVDLVFRGLRLWVWSAARGGFLVVGFYCAVVLVSYDEMREL